MRKMLIFACFLLLLVFTSHINLAHCLEWTVTYSIEIYSDCSAVWTVVWEAPLLTEEDRLAFLNKSSIESIERMWQSIQLMVEEASMITGRSMEVNDFKFSSSVFQGPGGERGIIRYSFKWTNFVRAENDYIKVGDALSGELDLNRGDTLVVKFPAHFKVYLALPPQDEIDLSKRTVIWFGPRNFGAGEPTIIFEKEKSDFFTFFVENLPMIILLITVFLSFPSFLVLKEKLRKRKVEPLDVKSEINKDKNRIIRLLQSYGGKLYQSEIVEHTRFSAAKTSMILRSLEEKGIITRKKIGNKKLVILKEKLI